MEIYLDNSATTRVLPSVAEKINKIYLDCYGNPSSLHRKGLAAEEEREEARKIIASSINAKKEEIIFTSGGTESNNLAILGYLKKNPRMGKKIIISAGEHASVSNIGAFLEGEGYEVVMLPVSSEGIPDYAFLSSAVDENTALVSVMTVNNETGYITDTAKIKQIIAEKNKNTVFMSDCVQAYMKLDIDVQTHGADMISLSSHKINGPKGIGALWVSPKIRLAPIIHGGGQEGNIRSGTENLPGICGFAEAVRIHSENASENREKLCSLKTILKNELENLGGVEINSPENGAPHILNASFPGIRSEIILHTLEMHGVYVSSGSACNSNFKDKKSVLARMGFDKKIYDSAIRFSFSFENTEEEVKAAAEIVKREIELLRKRLRIKN